MNLSSILRLAGVFFLLSGGAWSQTAIRIPTCGTASPPQGTSQIYMDATGDLCTSATGGGGGGTVNQGTQAASATGSTWFVQGAGTAGTPVGGVSSVQGVTGGAPLVDNIAQWSGSALGAPSNYGTSPGAVAVPGVNAFVTNVPAVTLNAGSAVAGKFGVDQTTPGTTNGVQVLTGSTTAATQATAANLNATVVGTGTFAVQSAGAINTTPTDCSGTITTGGTAQSALAAQTTLHGFTIANIDASAGSGEPLWVSFTTTAASATVASYPLAAPTATTFAGLSSFTTPPGFGLNHALSIIGVTTGHKFSCTWW